MGTFSQVNIKIDNLDAVLKELKKYLKIGREIWMNTEKEWFFNVQHSENSSTEQNGTIILAQNLTKDWIEINFGLGGNLYYYDEILRRISKTLETEILFANYQSTSGNGRLAKFKNGMLELSFYEKSFYYEYDDSNIIDRIYLADNFGIANSHLELIQNAKLGKDSYLLDYEFIYKYFKSEGWEPGSGKKYSDFTYLHIEEIK